MPALAGVSEKRALFRVFLETLRDPNLTGEHKVKCLSLVVIPVLTTTLEDPHTNNAEVVTDSLVSLSFRVLRTKNSRCVAGVYTTSGWYPDSRGRFGGHPNLAVESMTPFVSRDSRLCREPGIVLCTEPRHPFGLRATT